MTANKTIVYVCPSSSTFFRHHSFLALEAAKCNTVHAILTHDGGEDGLRILKDAGIIIHNLNMHRSSVNPLRVLLEAHALRRLLVRLSPDIINAINIRAVLTAALANAGRRTKLVGTVTGLGYMFSGDSFRQRLLRKATIAGLRRSLSYQPHTLVLSNRDDINEFINRRVTGKERILLIPVPGVDMKEFASAPEPEKGFRVVLPARMLWSKGVMEFIEAATALRARIPGSEFILAGAPDPANPASIPDEQLEKWEQRGMVKWLGHCHDMAGLMASCHVVCLPSAYREGLPRVLVEAMASQRAIVTTDTPGCREVGGTAGILVERGNAEMLEDALERLYSHPEERREYARNGRVKAVESFCRESITEEVLKCYS